MSNRLICWHLANPIIPHESKKKKQDTLLLFITLINGVELFLARMPIVLPETVKACGSNAVSSYCWNKKISSDNFNIVVDCLSSSYIGNVFNDQQAVTAQQTAGV